MRAKLHKFVYASSVTSVNTRLSFTLTASFMGLYSNAASEIDIRNNSHST